MGEKVVFRKWLEMECEMKTDWFHFEEETERELKRAKK